MLLENNFFPLLIYTELHVKELRISNKVYCKLLLILTLHAHL